MPARHLLSLEVPQSHNATVFRIFDTSLYADGLPVDCGTLQITAPGYNQPVSIEVEPHFNLVLSACVLGLQTSGCGTSAAMLPDGIYRIRYSVSPNDKVYADYEILRMTQTLNRWYTMLCDLELSACEPDAEIKEQLAELRLIRLFMDAAKGCVEHGGESEKGMELFIYAKKRLDKITC